MPINVLLDVDTGVDDALALLVAARSPELNILGVTCVAGNVELDKVVTNTLGVLEIAGRTDIPVARGLAQPLLEIQHNSKGVHGEDGMGNQNLPTPTRQPEAEHAIEFMRRILMASDSPITLIPLAPLTNIATLLLQHPEVKPKIKQIVFMGGTYTMGNASATAEFNVRQDPEASDIVLKSGVPTTMYGLEVFHMVNFSRAEVMNFTKSESASMNLAGRLMLFMLDNFGLDEIFIGDSGCVISVIEPEGLITENYPVRVELQGYWTRGETVVDRRPQSLRELEAQWMPPMDNEIAVATDLDEDRYRALFMQALQ